MGAEFALCNGRSGGGGEAFTCHEDTSEVPNEVEDTNAVPLLVEKIDDIFKEHRT